MQRWVEPRGASRGIRARTKEGGGRREEGEQKEDEDEEQVKNRTFTKG